MNPSKHNPPIKLTEEEPTGFGKQKHTLPNPRPFVKFYDQNNMNEQDLHACNPSVPAFVVGVRWDF